MRHISQRKQRGAWAAAGSKHRTPGAPHGEREPGSRQLKQQEGLVGAVLIQQLSQIPLQVCF